MPALLRALFLLSLALCARVASADGMRDLEIGVLPNLSTRVLMTQYAPLRDALARSLNRPARIATAPDWSRFTRRGLEGDYDLIVTAAHLARLQQVEAGLIPVGRFTPDIPALLVTRGDAPVSRLTDLRGKIVALPNVHSLVALQSLHRLAEAGLRPGQDLRLISVPTDDSVGNLLLRGDATAAVLSGGEFRMIPEDIRARLKVVQTVAEVPGFIVLASPRLDADALERLRRCLESFPGSSDGQRFAELTGFSGLTTVDDALMKSLDIHLPDARQILQAP